MGTFDDSNRTSAAGDLRPRHRCRDRRTRPADAHHPAAREAFTRFAFTGTELVIFNYAEALVRPAEEERTLRAAVDAMASLSIRTSAPDAAAARLAARRRALGVSLADGFAIATAERLDADLASFDRRVRRALEEVGPRLSGALPD